MPEDQKSLFRFERIACPVCGSDRSRVVGQRGGAAHHDGIGVQTSIVRCLQCTHLYPDPMPYPARDLDDLYTDTDAYFVNHNVEEKKRSGDALLREFETRLGGRGRFLDIGCGRGELLWAARASGWEYEGVDASSTYLAWGREHLGVEGRHGTVEDMRFPDAHFDAVTMGGVMEHLYDPAGTLAEVRRILRPGGLLWFDAPNESGLYARVGNLYMKLQGRDWCVNLAPTFPPYHVQGFTPASLLTLLARVGFEVISMQVEGEVCPATGTPSLRKRVEFEFSRLVNSIGRRFGSGIYMAALVRRLI
ncbi:MAG: methyltransferase domain-containing protein [Pyrinomonadaceae bacterium]|nr:methyltransferase domain-containing protein [Pyrinomonadaceae bacterium]